MPGDLTSAEAEYVVLCDACDEARCFDIPSVLSSFFPNSVDLIAISRKAVLTLLGYGLIAVYQGEPFDSDPIDSLKAQSIIASDSAWQIPPDGEPFIYVCPTKIGYKALKRYPGLSRKRQQELIDAMYSHPHPLMSEEKTAYWAARDPVILSSYQEPTKFRSLLAYTGVLVRRLLNKS